MAKFLILTDTRQQKESHITKQFDLHRIEHIQTKLDSADYMTIRYDDERGFYKDYSILIDTKKDLLEICGNLCKTTEHDRLVREVERGHYLGCEQFIFLIGESNIKSLDDIKNWKSKYTKISGTRLLKTMSTFQEHHNCRFIIVPKKDLGKRIIDIFNNK